jgi:hypothetical protein
MVAAWWATIALTPLVLSGFSALVAMAALFLLPIAVMSLRWRSVHHGLYSVAAWNVYALSFLPGLLRSRVSPTMWLDSTVLKDGAPADRGSALDAPRPAHRRQYAAGASS